MKIVKIISIKTGKGKYKVYRKEFANRNHFNNWANATMSYGSKIIGIEDTI